MDRQQLQQLLKQAARGIEDNPFDQTAALLQRTYACLLIDQDPIEEEQDMVIMRVGES